MSKRYWEPNLNQGNHFTEQDVIIGNLLAYIAKKEYKADEFGWFLKESSPYCKFNLDTMQPEILEYKPTL